MGAARLRQSAPLQVLRGIFVALRFRENNPLSPAFSNRQNHYIFTPVAALPPENGECPGIFRVFSVFRG